MKLRAVLVMKLFSISLELPAQQTDSFLEYFLGGERVRKMCKLQARPQMTMCVFRSLNTVIVFCFSFFTVFKWVKAKIWICSILSLSGEGASRIK